MEPNVTDKTQGTPARSAAAAKREHPRDQGSARGGIGGYLARSRWVSIGVLVISFVVIARTLPLDRAIQSLQGWFDELE